MADDIVYKRPNEIQTYDYDFTPKLPLDAALSSSTVSAVDEEGNSASVLGTKSASGLVLSVPLQNGTDGKDYTVTMQATGTTSADVREWVVEMRVRRYLQGVV
ncbi:MAG TPA: hypothetical protein VH593_28860 [Ktedonobacteraceae bacterium]|jgi:hypothetical protein